MDADIGIRMPRQAERRGDGHAAQDQGPARHHPVDVEPGSHARDESAGELRFHAGEVLRPSDLNVGFAAGHEGDRQPRLFVCGHIHERPGRAVLGKTLVVNCSMGRSGAGAWIEMETDREPAVSMLL